MCTTIHDDIQAAQQRQQGQKQEDSDGFTQAMQDPEKIAQIEEQLSFTGPQPVPIGPGTQKQDRDRRMNRHRW